MCRSTAPIICETWLDVCYDRIGSLVRWLDKKEVAKTIPVALIENFGSKVMVILDCFENFFAKAEFGVATRRGMVLIQAP